MKIQNFVEDWAFVRGKTLEFLATIPDDKMTWKPHDQLGTFGMQIRHVIKSQEAYLNGMKNETVEFSNKKFDPALETDKQKAIDYLKKLDGELIDFLNTADENKEIIFVDGVIGEKKIPITTVLDYMINHEIYHQGIFTCYGRLAGLGKFLFM
jgi:uncharacterized damage-inducible protein DinB